MQNIYAVVVAMIAYFGIQTWDDERARKEGKEPATMAKRIMLFFILLMVCLIGGHFVSNSWSGGGHEKVGVTIPSNDIWKRIPEEVHVGPPPF